MPRGPVRALPGQYRLTVWSDYTAGGVSPWVSRSGYGFNLVPQCRDVVRNYRRKRYYSTLQRILVQLSSDGGFQRDRLAMLTQEGIASAILSGRSTVTKCLDRLERSGWIVGERARVPGHRVRKTAYRLTEAGWEKAEDLRRRLENDTVEVSGPDLDWLTVKVQHIHRVLPTYLGLSTALSLVREGRVDLTRAPIPMPTTTTAVLWGQTIPQVSKLVGRAKELKALDTWMGGTTPILVVTGIAGIGKSWLVADWVLQFQQYDRIFWHELGSSRTINAFLSSLAEFLRCLGKRGLSEYLAEKRPPDLEVVGRLLVHELQGAPILLVMDSFERVPASVSDQVAQMMFRVSREAGSRLIVISRKLAPVLEEEGSRATRVITVGPLDLESSIALLTIKGQGGEKGALRRLAASTHGHPLLLSLVASAGMATKQTLRRYLHDEIWNDLGPRERASLEAAAIFRSPPPTHALTAIPGVSESALASLQARNLVEQTVGGQISVHELIRDFVRSHAKRTRLRRLHSHAADYFLDLATTQDQLEGIYHLIEADHVPQAARFIEMSGSTLVDSASISDMAAVIRQVDLDGSDPRSASILSEFLGDAQRIMGNLDLALWQYRHALRRCEKSRRLNRIPTLYRKIASIERRRGQYSRALESLSAAKTHLRPGSNLAESAEALLEMALVAKAQGDLSTASAYLDEAIDFATEASDLSTLARCILTLGSLEGWRGNLERGLDFKLEGLRLAMRSGNLTEAARGLIHVGTAYGEMGLLQKSLEYHTKALSLARMLGNLRLIAYASMNSFAALVDLGKFEESKRPLSEARSIFRILEEQKCLAVLDITEGNREMGLRHVARARSLWHRGLQALRNLGDLGNLAVSLRDVAKVSLRHGNTDVAQAHLMEAQEIARKLGNASLEEQTEALLSRIAHGGIQLAANPPKSAS